MKCKRVVICIAFMMTCVLSQHLAGQSMVADAAEPGLMGKAIVVDAGHGGPDGGARSQAGDAEKHITLAIALKLRSLLEQAGATVYMTRSSDDDLASDEDRRLRRRHQSDLKGRFKVFKAKHADAFVSIHCNAVPSAVWRGSQVLYLDGNEEGKAFAQVMQGSFQELLLPTKRDIQKNSTLYLLKRIKGPAVLAEVGFLSNPDEAREMLTPRYQSQIAFAMYAAITQYFGQHTHAHIIVT